MTRFTLSRLTRASTLAGLGLALSLGVHAQGMGGMGMSGHGMQGHDPMGDNKAQHAHMAQRWEARQQDLKAKLKLSSGQEAAWHAFAQAVKPPSKPAVSPLDHESLAKMNTPERLDKMAAFHEAHQADMQAHMKQRSDATKQFYAQLTPEQQKIFDAQTLPREPHNRGRMGQGLAAPIQAN